MKSFKVNDVEYNMVDKIDEITLDQFYRLEDCLQNQYGLVDSQILLNIFEILSDQPMNSLGDMDADTASELTNVFTSIEYSNIDKSKKDLDFITINGIDYVFKKDNRYSKMTLTERIHIDLIFKNINSYLDKNIKYKEYNDKLTEKNVKDWLYKKGEISKDEYDAYLLDYSKWYKSIDLDNFIKYLEVKLEANIDQNLTILAIMCQPGYSEVDKELNKVIWKQHPFSNQNLEWRKEMFRREMKAIDGLKPIAFFLNGLIESMNASLPLPEVKHQPKEEDTLSHQYQRA